MGPIVVKFGGSSLATAGQFEKVAAIIRENSARRYVVASAPGKRCSDDTKVTDLLYRCYDAACAGEDFLPTLTQIRQRFEDIIAQLHLQADLAADFDAIAAHLRTAPQRDYMASRGEYLNSKLLAAYLGVPFVDAAQMVLFHADGSFDAEATNTAIGHALVNVERAVIPGFYGALPDGTIHTFSRGGSDVTGSIVARAVGAELYENWMDVSGVLAADPRIVENPHIIDYITYRELRELSYMGASVLHEIETQLHPDHVSVEDGLALIAVVGQGMIYAKGTAARIFRVIADANINIRMIDQGSSELNIIIAVRETDYELAIRSLYHAVERVM